MQRNLFRYCSFMYKIYVQKVLLQEVIIINLQTRRVVLTKCKKKHQSVKKDNNNRVKFEIIVYFMVIIIRGTNPSTRNVATYRANMFRTGIYDTLHSTYLFIKCKRKQNQIKSITRENKNINQ